MMQKLNFKYKLAINLINILSKTWRIRLEGDFEYKGNGIIVFWHGSMLPIWKYFGKYNPLAVVSLSKDGEILSQILEKWSFSLIRGSSSRKGKDVLEDITNHCKDRLLLITPDGPKGPIYKMKAGAVVAASRTQVPIYLCGIKMDKSWIFNKSWDKFRVPYPFSKVILNISKAIYIENTENRKFIDEKISQLETNLLYLSNIEK